MQRTAMEDLKTWARAKRRKPLLLNGARQVGKTWLLQELGRQCFDNTAYISLDGNQVIREQLDMGYDLPRLLLAMQAQCGEDIVPGRTLLILDEIQECPKALTSLKYFCERMPQLAVAAAGSLLGTTVHAGTGYPVGKVTTKNIFPLSFREYLDAVGRSQMRELIHSGDQKLLSSFVGELAFQLRNYFFVGGMPEAVVAFVEQQSYSLVRTIQNGILEGYERDISKHLPGTDVEPVLAAWHSIPRHLSQENKRFVFGHVKEGARGRGFRRAIEWLVQAGIAVRVPRVTKPGVPLKAYADLGVFKLYMLDIGLLGAAAGLNADAIISGDSAFVEFKGAMTEQYVCQELRSECNLEPFYWTAPKGGAKVDFLVQRDTQIYGIEVKAAENLRSKSLRAFHDRFPETQALRFSLSGFRSQGWMRNVPLPCLAAPDIWQASEDSDTQRSGVSCPS